MSDRKGKKVTVKPVPDVIVTDVRVVDVVSQSNVKRETVEQEEASLKGDLKRLKETVVEAQPERKWYENSDPTIKVHHVQNAAGALVTIICAIGITALSAPPILNPKLFGMGVIVFIWVLALIATRLRIFRNSIEYFLSTTDQSKRRAFLMSVIESEDMRNKYFARAPLSIANEMFFVSTFSPYTIGDELIIELEICHSPTNQFCKLTTESISWDEYSNASEERRAELVSTRLGKVLRTFGVQWM